MWRPMIAKRRPNSHEPGHLLHETQVVSIEEQFCVMVPAYGGRQRSLLSKALCLLQLIYANNRRQMTVSRPSLRTGIVWGRLREHLEIRVRRIRNEVLKQLLLHSPLLQSAIGTVFKRRSEFGSNRNRLGGRQNSTNLSGGRYKGA